MATREDPFVDDSTADILTEDNDDKLDELPDPDRNNVDALNDDASETLLRVLDVEGKELELGVPWIRQPPSRRQWDRHID